MTLRAPERGGRLFGRLRRQPQPERLQLSTLIHGVGRGWIGLAPAYLTSTQRRNKNCSAIFSRPILLQYTAAAPLAPIAVGRNA